MVWLWHHNEAMAATGASPFDQIQFSGDKHSLISSQKLHDAATFRSTDESDDINNIVFPKGYLTWKSRRAAKVCNRNYRVPSLVSKVLTDTSMPMTIEFDRLDNSGIAQLLKQCGNVKDVSDGKLIHSHLIRNGKQGKVFLGNHLIQMYGDCGALNEALLLFDYMPLRNTFSWNILISAYAERGKLDDVVKIFGMVPEKDVVTWTSIISLYVEHGDIDRAFRALQSMHVMPDRITFVTLVDGCANQGALAQAKKLHSYIESSVFESDVVVGNALVNMYCRCGLLKEAGMLFNKMPTRNVVSWTTMITGYSRHLHGNESLLLFRQMKLEGIMPDKISYISILDACNSLQASGEGKLLHACILRGRFLLDIILATAIENMYAKCGNIKEAEFVFTNMSERNVVSWNAMILGYAELGYKRNAMQCFRSMQAENLIPNEATFICILGAYTSKCDLFEGKQMHAFIMNSGLETDVRVATALVNMYGKCGSMEDAKKTFEKVCTTDVVLWNAIVAAYAQNGHPNKAIWLYQKMQLANILPEKITYVSILSVCCHVGWIAEGCGYFVSMSQDYGVKPIVEHYNCVINLLARAGHLEEADDLIHNMVMDPTAASWSVLLFCCRIHQNVDVGKRAAEHVLQLNKENTVGYVLLSNIYAASGLWGDAERVRKLMKDEGLEGIDVDVDNFPEIIPRNGNDQQKNDIYDELLTFRHEQWRYSCLRTK